jgi:ABC-type Zn uptake system ZnuABC Zn-binding protein ZnuA
MKTLGHLCIASLCLLGLHGGAQARLKVVTSTSDLAYFTRVVGGEWVEVQAIAPAAADVHFIEVRPSYMVKTSHADVVVKVGLELDLWMDKIVDGSHNDHLTLVDAARYIEPLDVPTFKADARYGDLHRFGNPHYWLTPENVAPITQAICEGLSSADPEHADLFKHNRDAYLQEVSEAIPKLLERAAPLKETRCLSYHTSWAYFTRFTGLQVAGTIEEYPGVPPSPSHVAELVDLVRKAGIRLIVVEPYFDKRIPDKIASETGARVITLYPSLGARRSDETYLEFLQSNIDALVAAP